MKVLINSKANKIDIHISNFVLRISLRISPKTGQFAVVWNSETSLCKVLHKSCTETFIEHRKDVGFSLSQERRNLCVTMVNISDRVMKSELMRNFGENHIGKIEGLNG